jgi:hypothetical protein
VKKILFLPLLLFFFNGCLNYIQDVQLYPDGSGKMHIHYWMPVPDSTGVKIIENMGFFKEDSIKKEFSSPFTTIDNVKVYSDSTDSTTHAEIGLSFTHIDSLNKTKAFADANFSFKDGAARQKVFTRFIAPIATGFGINGDKFRVTYKYTFSGEIITHNATSVEGRTLIWSYTLNEIGSGKTISVTFVPYKIKETPYWIYALTGAVLLLVLFFLFRKKKD